MLGQRAAIDQVHTEGGVSEVHTYDTEGCVLEEGREGDNQISDCHMLISSTLSLSPLSLSSPSLNLQVIKLMDHMPFFLETKFDGDRMQLHKQGNQYRYFSRRCTIVSVSEFLSQPPFGKKSKAVRENLE